MTARHFGAGSPGDFFGALLRRAAAGPIELLDTSAATQLVLGITAGHEHEQLQLVRVSARRPGHEWTGLRGSICAVTLAGVCV